MSYDVLEVLNNFKPVYLGGLKLGKDVNIEQGKWPSGSGPITWWRAAVRQGGIVWG